MSGASTLGYRADQVKAVWHRQLPSWSSVLVCLTRRVPSSNAAPDQLDEPVGLGYARVTVAVSAANWPLQNSTEVGNGIAIVFPEATGLWGDVAGWAVLSAETTPKTLAVGTLAEPVRVSAGIQPVVQPGAIVFGVYD